MPHQPVKEETGTQHEVREGDAWEGEVPAEPAADPRVARVKQSARNSAAPWLLIGGGFASLLLLVAAAGGLMWLMRGGSEPTIDPVLAAPDTTLEADGGPATPLSDKFALQFDGLRSHVEIPTLKYDGSHSITLEAYVRPRSIANSPAVISGCGLILNANAPRNLWNIVAFRKGGGYVFARPSLPIRLDERVHLAGVFDDNALTMFIDGKRLAHQGDIVLELWESSFFIGADHTVVAKNEQAGYFDGLIDEVRISKVARYDTDFTPADRFENDAGTWALYHFDEGTGDVLNDSSGNDHQGKIVGAKWVRVEPRLSSALKFDGLDDFVEIPTLDLLTPRSLTVEAWMRAAPRSAEKPANQTVVAQQGLGGFRTLFVEENSKHGWEARLSDDCGRLGRLW